MMAGFLAVSSGVLGIPLAIDKESSKESNRGTMRETFSVKSSLYGPISSGVKGVIPRPAYPVQYGTPLQSGTNAKWV